MVSDKLLEEFVDDLKYLVLEKMAEQPLGSIPDIKVKTLMVDANRLHENIYRQEVKAVVVNAQANTEYCNLVGAHILNYDDNFSVLTMLFSKGTKE